MSMALPRLRVVVVEHGGVAGAAGGHSLRGATQRLRRLAATVVHPMAHGESGVAGAVDMANVLGQNTRRSQPSEFDYLRRAQDVAAIRAITLWAKSGGDVGARCSLPLVSWGRLAAQVGTQVADGDDGVGRCDAGIEGAMGVGADRERDAVAGVGAAVATCVDVKPWSAS